MTARSCPKCESIKIHVVESHQTHNGRAKRLRRRCCTCNHAWTIYEVTVETLDYYKDLEKKLHNIKKIMLSLTASTETCDDCVQYATGACSLDIPEAGGTFAAEFSYFSKP